MGFDLDSRQSIGILQLVGGLEHEWIMTFHSVGNFITPTESYFSEG